MNRIGVSLILVAVVAACNGARTYEGDGGAAAADDGAAMTADASPDAGTNTPDAGLATPDAGGDLPDAASAGDAAIDAGPAALRVLFIGNSYTYVNDLPGMLKQIASTAGVPPTIDTDSVVQGAATLQVHLDNGIAQTRISEQQWTHVVLQGQSMEALYPGNENFITAALKLGDMAIEAGARPALFVTWARAPADPMYGPSGVAFNPEELQDLITRGYDDAAKQLPGSILSCVGETFRRSLMENPAIVLHQDDNSHPTVAGTYLAANTFYVALTGTPVPPASYVPPEIERRDAEALRKTALVGTDCAEVHLKSLLTWGDCSDTACRSFDPDPIPCMPRPCSFDFGTAGTPIPQSFIVSNTHYATAGIADGLTLAPPFAWTSGAYPGGTGTATDSSGMQYPFCADTLPPQASCAVSVTYSGVADGSGTLTLTPGNTYDTSNLTRKLSGSPTTRALLTVSQGSGFFGQTDAGGPALVWAYHGGSPQSLNLLVSNRGGLPTTTLGVGVPLSPPFYWGPDAISGAFPGGSGTGEVGGVACDYCTTQTLGAGRQCMVTVVLAPAEGDTQLDGAVNLAYSDAQGPVSPNANRNIRGDWAMPFFRAPLR